MPKMQTFIPFPGFYESLLNDELQQEFEDRINCYSKPDPDTAYDVLRDNITWAKAYEHVAKAFVEGFNHCVRDHTTLDLELHFEALISPREYNFTTDRVRCLIPRTNVYLLSAGTSYEAFETVVKERFTPYSGFIPFYSNNANDWLLKKSLTDWDANEVETLLCAWLRQELQCDDLNSFQDEIIGHMRDNAEFITALDDAIDWDKLQNQIEALQGAKDE